MRTSPSKEALGAVAASVNRIHDGDASDTFADYARHHSERLALDLDWMIETVDKAASVLEIGGFPFFLTSALKEKGYEIQTVDKLNLSASRLSDQLDLKIIGCDIEIEKLPFADDSFDDVLLNEVFEHLRIDLIFTVNEIRRVLKPGGRLWLSTPNLRSLRGIANFLFKSEAWSVVGDGLYAQYRSLKTVGHMGHTREYTSKEVANFLQSIGFKIEAILYRGRYQNPAARLASGIAPSLKPYFSILATK